MRQVFNLINAKGVMQPIEIGGFTVGQTVIIKGREYAIVQSSEDARASTYSYGQRAICVDDPTWIRDVSPSNFDDLSPMTKITGYGRLMTNDEVAALRAKSDSMRSAEDAERRRKQKEREEAQTKGREMLEEMRPSWAKAVIVAEYRVDDSDMQTDCFGSHVDDVVLLGWSKHTRDLFDEMRRYAVTFEETRHLSTDKKYERREKYSMGAGYYLGDDRWSGWQVRKEDLAYPYGLTQLCESLAKGNGLSPHLMAATGTSAKTDNPVNAVTISLNAERNGIEITFPDKPSEATRESLKANGFRWSRNQGLWYSKQSPERIAFAESLKA